VWQDIVSWIAGGGLFGLASLVVWWLNRWHRDVIAAMGALADAERRRADEWRSYGNERDKELHVLREQVLRITLAASPTTPGAASTK
jgi:hypothetical protein